MYKIMILYKDKSHLWKQYGTSTTVTVDCCSGAVPTAGYNAATTVEKFTEFSTDKLEELEEELIKLDAIYGHENIRPYKDLTATYTVEIEGEEE